MIINPQEAISQGWVSGIRNPEVQIQPNAIDYTFDKAFKVNTGMPFFINEDRKEMRGSEPYEPHEIDQFQYPSDPPMDMILYAHPKEPNGWRIGPGGMIDVLSDMYVDLPEGVAAILVPRSTFVRNGLFTQNGLYDSGFAGHIGTILHNRAGHAVVGQGTRLGQVMFVEAGTSGMYSGGYNHEQGSDLDYQDGEK